MARIETVVIIQKDSKIMLGLKHPDKKFGGKWNGFGGGLEEGETLEECAIRETVQETGITPRGLEKRGVVLFMFVEKDDEPDHEVHFYIARDYEGELNTSKDFTEYKKFSSEELEEIYDQMMPADRHWLPFFMKGKMFGGEVHFSKDFKVIYYKINEVQSLD